MSKDNNLHDFLQDVADAIKEKKGSNDAINAQDFSDEIKNLPSGGEVATLEEEVVDNSGKGISQIKKVVIADGVTEIGSNAFYQVSTITSVIAPNSVKIIKANAFYNCKGVKSFNFPQFLEVIDTNAFYLSGLESADLPSTMTRFGGGVFFASNSLSKVICRATTPPSLGSNNVFNSTSASLIIYVPDASVESYKAATNWVAHADKIKGLSELPNE